MNVIVMVIDVAVMRRNCDGSRCLLGLIICDCGPGETRQHADSQTACNGTYYSSCYVLQCSDEGDGSVDICVKY